MSIRGHSSSRKEKNASGITLMELAISMTLFSVLSIGIANLLSSGMDAQLAYRVHEAEHNIAMNILDRLRFDLLTASNAVIGGGGNTLTITRPPTNGGGTIVWVFNNATGTVTRDGILQSINPGPNIQIRVDCGINGAPACLQGFDGNGNLGSTPFKRVVLHELTVTHVIPSGAGTAVDREFGAARFRVNEFTFEILANTQFQ